MGMTSIQIKAVDFDHLDSAVCVGGWRQWIEEGRAIKAQKMLDVLKRESATKPLPKTLKMILKTLNVIIAHKLNKSSALEHESVACYVCGGHAKLDDDCSPCQCCSETGLLWYGVVMKNADWLWMASERYLQINQEKRAADLASIKDKLINNSGELNGK
jgi:hypothetical protein